MELSQNTRLVDAQFTPIYVQVVKHLDFSLSPLERIIFLRLCLSYRLFQDTEKSDNCISTQNIKEVAACIDIHYLKLKSALDVLVQKDLFEVVGKHRIQLSKSFRVSIKQAGSCYLTEHLPLHFFTILFESLFSVRISHKQKKAQDLLKLNYQQWLVLFHLLWLSDAHGMVLEADTHTLINHTGMSREALLRAITALFEYGILRVKVNGSLNHNFLNSVSAVYFLNLSHSIWRESRLYADYYILKFPDDYQSVTYQAFTFIQRLYNQSPKIEHLNSPEFKISGLKYDSCAEVYQIQYNNLSNFLIENYQVGMKLDQTFIRYLSLLSPHFKWSEGKLNGIEENLERTNLLLKRYWQQHLLNPQQITHAASALFDEKSSRWFSASLRPMQLSLEAQAKVKQEQMNLVHVQEALEDIRNQILFGIAQLVFQSELFPVLQQMLALSFITDDPKHALQPIRFAVLGQGLPQQQIYYVLKPKQQQDCFFLLEFIELEGSVKGYEIQCRTLELDANQQQAYGLLDPRFKTFSIQEEQSEKNSSE